jgi:hypothetical protein
LNPNSVKRRGFPPDVIRHSVLRSVETVRCWANCSSVHCSRPIYAGADHRLRTGGIWTRWLSEIGFCGIFSRARAFIRRRSRWISWRHTVPRRRSRDSPAVTDPAACGRTVALKTHICTFEDASESSKNSSRKDRPKDFFPPTPPATTSLIFNPTRSVNRRSANFGMRRVMPGLRQPSLPDQRAGRGFRSQRWLTRQNPLLCLGLRPYEFAPPP